MFPPISSQQTRPASEDLNGVGTTSGAAEIQSPSKQNQIRRQQQQQTTDQQRRTPLRSNSLIPSTTSRYVSSTAAVATAAVQSPSVSISPLVRSPSFVQTGTSAQYEPAKSELDVTILMAMKNSSSLILIQMTKLLTNAILK